MANSKRDMVFPKELQQLLEFAPVCVVYGDDEYFLNITRSGQGGYIVDYRLTDKTIVVKDGEVSFQRIKTIFSTYRKDKLLYVALSHMLDLLYNERGILSFIPRIHPFNKKD